MAIDYQGLENIKAYLVKQGLYLETNGILQCEDVNLSDADSFEHLIYFLNIQNNADFYSFPLTRIELRNCSLSDNQIEKLIEVLDKHPLITYIDLKENLVTDKGAALLEKYASKYASKRAISIDLRFNKISENHLQQGSLLNISDPEQIDLHFDDKYDESPAETLNLAFKIKQAFHDESPAETLNLAFKIKQAFHDELAKGQFDAGRALNELEYLPGVPRFEEIGALASTTSNLEHDPAKWFVEDCKKRIDLFIDKVFPLLFDSKGKLHKPLAEIFDNHPEQKTNLETAEFKIKIFHAILVSARGADGLTLAPADAYFTNIFLKMMQNATGITNDWDHFVSSFADKQFTLTKFKEKLFQRFELPEKQQYLRDFFDGLEDKGIYEPQATCFMTKTSNFIESKKEIDKVGVKNESDSVPLKVLIPLAILFAPVTLMVVTVFLIHEVFSKALSMLPEVKPPKDLYNTANPVRNVTTAKSVIEHTALPQTLSK